MLSVWTILIQNVDKPVAFASFAHTINNKSTLYAEKCTFVFAETATFVA